MSWPKPKVTRTEEFVRCCDKPPLVDCCGCDGPEAEKLMPTVWEIQEAPNLGNSWLTYYDLDGNLHELVGYKFAWGCEQFDRADIRRIVLKDAVTYPEPIFTGSPRTYCGWFTEEPALGKCCELGCPEEDCATVGHGGPECYRPAISCFMTCFTYDEIPPIDPIYYWYAEGMTELYCADSEWSAEDCLLYDAQSTGPCHACGDLAPMASEADCLATKAYLESLGYVVGDCYEAMADPGSPGHPSFVDRSAGFSGPCACSRSYKFLDRDNDYTLRVMLDELGSTDLPPWDCDGCNTFVLYQYRPENEDNPNCLSCIKDGADGPCQCSGAEFGLSQHGYGCCNPPATITLCPATYRDGIDPGSVNICDFLCCDEAGEVVEENRHLPMAMTPDLPPEDSVFWSINGTSSNGYLVKSDDGLYRGEFTPFKFELNKEAKTLNGKAINMLSQDVFWGTVFFGRDYGWQIELMA